MFRSFLYGTSLCLVAVSVMAQEPESTDAPVDATPPAEAQPAEPAAPAADEPAAGAWSGSAELGATVTSGNSDTRNINGKAEVQHERDRWRQTARAEALTASDSGVDTAERYVASYKADYKKTKTTYIFGTIRGEVDKFSGYDYRLSEALGYGRRFWEGGDKGYFELEAGPGARQSKLEDGTREDEAILHMAAKYRNKWTDTTEFSQDVTVESGSDNTFSESVTGIKVKINSHLAMKLSVTVKHNSDVPVDTENTDTISSLNLVFDF